MRVDVSTWEKTNIVARDGQLRVRDGFRSVKTPTAGTAFIGGFSIESPFTSEPNHYLVERSTTTGLATLRVFTEEFVELYSYSLGYIGAAAVFTHGVANNQVMISSPSASVTLYGLVAGGLIRAMKPTASIEAYTPLDVPVGHVAAVGDRIAIAAGHALYINSARADADPREFVAQGAVSMPGTIYDLFEGPDGALFVFHSAGCSVIPRDAFASATIQPAASNLAGVATTRPRNAAVSNGTIAVLGKSSITLLGAGGRREVPVFTRRAGRFLDSIIDVEDLRAFGEVFPTPRGFLVGFRVGRGFFFEVDLVAGSESFVAASGDLSLVGTLRGRSGELLVVMSDRVLLRHGNADWTGARPVGVMNGRVDVAEDERPKLRRVTTSADNIGEAQSVIVAGTEVSNETTPAKTRDVIIGTDTWTDEGYIGSRETRTVRHSFAVARSDLQFDLSVTGGGRRIERFVDLEFTGQGRRRRDQR